MKNVKCIVAGVLAGVFMVGGVSEWTVAAESTQDTFVPDEEQHYIGDIDGNGKVEISDVQEILGCVLHLKTSSAYDSQPNRRRDFFGDMDENGELSWDDAMQALKVAIKINGMSAAEIITKERNQGYEIIYESEDMSRADDIFTIDSEEELEEYQGYLCGGVEEYQKELLDRYQGIFDQYNLLVVKAAVYSTQIEDVTTGVVRNGRRVLAEVRSDYVPQSTKEYQYTQFLCVDKSISEDKSIMDVECDGIVGRVDIVMMDFDPSYGMDKDKNTVEFGKITPYRHLLRNTEEASGYRQFLKQRFDVSHFTSEAYYSRFTSSFFYDHAYVVFTYRNGLGTKEYRVLGMNCAEDGVLHVKLQWYDTRPGAVGYVAGTYGVFVSVPTDMAAKIDKVEMEIVDE